MEQSFDTAILDAQPPIHYVWDFGDNHVSFDSNPVHAYDSPGEYRVWLNVMDADGHTGNAIHLIQVRHDVFQKDQQMTYHYLSATHAHCIYWDQFKDNIAWIGTKGGLIRVDFEHNFQQYYRNQLPSGTVQDICQMYDQSIWIATTGGLVQFNTLTLEWNTFNPFNSGLTVKSIYALATSMNQQKLWIGTMGGGFFCWDAFTKTWSEYSPHNFEMPTANIWDLTIDNQDNLWAATHRGLIFVNTLTNNLQIFQTENSGLPDNMINVVRHDLHNHIWMGTWNQGVVRFLPENNVWTQFNLNNSPLTDNFIDHLTSTPNGHIWIATKENGLLSIDPETDSWQTFSTSHSSDTYYNIESTDENAVIINVNDALVKMETNGQCQLHTRLIHQHLPDNSVSCLTQLTDGTVWAGFRYKGLMQLYPKTHEWQFWDPMNSPLDSYDIRCIHEMSGNKIAVGTTNGLALFDINARQWTVFQTQNSELPHKTVLSILYDTDASLWIGTMNGIARLYPSNFQWKTYENITDAITCMAQTTDGRIWAGSDSNGFLEYKHMTDSWERYNESNSDLPDNHIQTMISGQNRTLWIGTATKGLSCLDLDLSQFEHFNPKNSDLNNATINAIAESKSGVIWVGTNDNHIYRFHPLTHEWHAVALSENASDISSIMDIAIESEDNLWIGTQENGILHVSWPQSLESPGSVIIVDNSLNRFSKYDHDLLVQDIYHTFIKNNFRHDDIWLITHTQEIDINGDACADSVIDGLPDQNHIIETITQWASERYNVNTPLFVFFLGQWNRETEDHELSYMISNNQALKVSQLHDALSLYEQKTRGQVIVVIDGKGSNDSFVHLSSKERILILSDSDPDDQENVYSSFIPYFMHQISTGQTIYQSFIDARKQTVNWMYHQANPLLDDNGDGIYNDLDGSFARQVKLISSQNDFLEPGIQDVHLSSDISNGASITILCNYPMAHIQAQLISLSGGYSYISIAPLEKCRITSYCGSIQNISPTGNYELIVMAKDYQGQMITSESKIIQIGNQKNGSIWGKVNLMLDSHEISFVHTNAAAILVNTDWNSIIHSDGTFTMDDIPEGTYEMRIDGPGFSLPLSETIQISAGELTQLTPITIDVAQNWCSIDSDCNGQFDLKDVIHLLQVLAGGE
jgi:ligand-binding sensor domain-containing protein